MKIFFGLFILLTTFTPRAHAQNKPGKVGTMIPAFSLTDQNGKAFDSAEEYKKHILVVYFYPKDESMVCTKEACAFRDSFDDFTTAGAKVVGINSGSVASHKAFTDHYKLPFTLLSDPGNKVLKQFGVGTFMITGRETFVIDRTGKIVYHYSSMLSGKGHAEEALKYIKSAKK